MYHCSETTLTPETVKLALDARNMSATLGITEHSRYRRVADVHTVTNDVINVKNVIRKLPKPPLDVTLGVHWLAVRGKMPGVAENVTAEELERAQAEIIETTLPREYDVNPVPEAAGREGFIHDGEHSLDFVIRQGAVLPELGQMFLDLVAGVLRPNADLSGLPALLTSVSTGAHVGDIVPFIVRAAHVAVADHLDDLGVVTVALRVLGAVMANQRMTLEPYLHDLLPTILTATITETVGPESDDTVTGQDARTLAVELLHDVLHRFGPKYPRMQDQAFAIIGEALNNGSQSAFYGALLTLHRFGGNAVVQHLDPIIGSIVTEEAGQLSLADRFKGEEARTAVFSLLLATFKKAIAAGTLFSAKTQRIVGMMGEQLALDPTLVVGDVAM